MSFLEFLDRRFVAIAVVIGFIVVVSTGYLNKDELMRIYYETLKHLPDISAIVK